VLDFSLLFIVQVFLFSFVGGESVCPVGYAGLSWGWLGEFCMNAYIKMTEISQINDQMLHLKLLEK
jgi:hypothetical protein